MLHTFGGGPRLLGETKHILPPVFHDNDVVDEVEDTARGLVQRCDDGRSGSRKPREDDNAFKRR